MSIVRPEEQIGNLLRQLGWTIAAAESCTGGLVCHRLTNVPGSSDYFLGGITAYSYQVKADLLEIPWDVLNSRGAVSEQVVRLMAENVGRKLSSEVGIAISGIAGPGGGTPEKPVGLAWIGLHLPGKTAAYRYHHPGSRRENKAAFAQKALELILEELEDYGGH